MIKNVIFDVGDVLINSDMRDYIKSFGYSTERAEALNQALSIESIWRAKDLGIYRSYVEAVPAFQEQHPELAQEIADFFKGPWMEQIYNPLEEGITLYNKVKEKGYDIYLLTNYSIDSFAYIEKKYDFIREVKGKIVSSHVQCCKPDRKIFQMLLDKYHLDAAECIFFDDNLSNVLAARNIGINAVQFKDLQEALCYIE